jgi:hypothetical protein
MEPEDDRRQQIIKQALEAHAGSGHADAVEQSLHKWAQLAGHLSPLIGDAGLCALYGRAQRLAALRHSMPSLNASASSVPLLLANLRESLNLAGPDDAGQANAALLDTFTMLLSTLIGEALTIRLMNAAWNDESQQKNKQEHK